MMLEGLSIWILNLVIVKGVVLEEKRGQVLNSSVGEGAGISRQLPQAAVGLVVYTINRGWCLWKNKCCESSSEEV